MESYTNHPGQVNEEMDSRPSGRWLVWPVVLLGLVIAYGIYSQRMQHRQLLARFDELRADVSLLQARANVTEQNYVDLKAHAEITSQNLTRTDKQLAQARSLTRRIREQQDQNVAQLSSELKQHETQLGSLSGDVSQVKSNVAETKEDLAATKTQLERTVGDLGLQSGLIAHTREELAELRRRGERNYLEFNVGRSREFTRVGDIAVRLNKIDLKRNKYALTLQVNDKRIEKKDRTIYEPVQFYPERGQSLFELVVFEMDQKHVAGYLSIPKVLTARQESP